MFKRKYERKLLDRATSNKENRKFLLDRFRREWEEIERTVKNDQRKQELYRIARESGEVLGLTILGMAAVCGILVVGLVAPNVFSAFGRHGGRRRYFDKNSFNERIYYYKQRGYVELKRNKEDKTMEVELTDLGEKKLMKQALENFKIHASEKWDGVWRVVIFDISEKNKWAREGLREYLKRMGFYPLQKSTFVYPYPCQKEIEFLCGLYRVDHQLRYIETNSISFDADLKSFFGLNG